GHGDVGGTTVREVRQVTAGDLDRFGLIRYAHVDHAVRDLFLDGTDVLGSERAETATFDHRRATHAQVGVVGGNDHVTHAGERGVAREAAAADDGDHRGPSRQACEQVEGEAV